MISAVQSALGGLRTASERFDRAATDIVRAGAQPVAVPEPEDADAAPATKPAPSVPVLDAPQEPPSLAESVLALKEAETLYKASAKLLGALHRLEGELLKI